MSNLDLQERNVKIEHIEGFLYGIQEIDNHVLFSHGATNEYSILEVNKSANSDDEDLLIDLILDRIKYNNPITSQIRNNFSNNIADELIIDWKKEFKTELKKWFIDKHISEKNIRESSIKYMNQFDDWTSEQKEKFISNFTASEKRAKDRLQNSNQSLEIFINMIEVFMKEEFKVTKYTFEKVVENKEFYPRSMNYFWGLEFDFYHLKNYRENVVLHFGKLLN